MICSYHQRRVDPILFEGAFPGASAQISASCCLECSCPQNFAGTPPDYRYAFIHSIDVAARLIDQCL